MEREGNIFILCPAMSVNEIKLLKINRNHQANVTCILISHKVLIFQSTYYTNAKIES